MAAQVDHDPSDVAEEGDGYGGADEGQERLNHSQTDDSNLCTEDHHL